LIFPPWSTGSDVSLHRDEARKVRAPPATRPAYGIPGASALIGAQPAAFRVRVSRSKAERGVRDDALADTIRRLALTEGRRTGQASVRALVLWKSVKKAWQRRSANRFCTVVSD